MGTLKKTSCALVLIAVLSHAPAFAQSDGAGQEGIKVHGDWTLTVRNPDGTIAAVHEFKNALSVTTGADGVLARLLLGTASTGQWSIAFGMNPPGGCGVGPNCVITESTTLFPGHSTDLTKTIPTTGPDAGKFVLRGSVRFVNATNITVVTTNLATCTTSATPTCNTGAPEFTRKLLQQLTPVAPDQLVEVKVVISFS